MLFNQLTVSEPTDVFFVEDIVGFLFLDEV